MEEAQGRLYGPPLVFEERSFQCGYAPRKLLASRFHQNTIFVGAKDGSVTVLSPVLAELGSEDRFLSLGAFKEAPESSERVLAEAGAVQAFCEWDEDRLLLARSSGSLEVVLWDRRGGLKEADPEVTFANCPRDPVRCLVPLDPEWILIAYRETGLTILDRRTDGPLEPRKVGGGNPVQSIRTIFPLCCGEGKAYHRFWFLLTDRGDLYQWNGDPGESPFPVKGIWSEGRRPSLISDYCLVRDETARKEELPAREVLLATDRGLYVLFFELRESLWEPRLRRLALTGLNATPMVLSYTSYILSGSEAVREYLWVTDLQGDSHLFWGDGSKKGGERSFWRSGVHQSRSETLACALLPEAHEASAFFVAQVRRDDRIVLGRYWDPEDVNFSDQPDESRKDLMLRELLNFGRYRGASGPGAIRLYLQNRYAKEASDEEVTESWWERNDAAIIAELFEYLAEDEERRQILLESLRGPYADSAQKLLDAGGADSGYASQLWRLALLGILHRSPGNQKSSYLGLMRWLRHRQVELPDREQLKDLARGLDKDLLLVRKWGLQGGVNTYREDLVEPQRILAEQEKQEKRIRDQSREANEELERLVWERLTYRAELFGRSVNLIDEDRDGRLRGRTAWATSVLPRAGHTLVAVSWMWGGVEVFSLKSRAGRSPKLSFLWSEYEADSSDLRQHVLRRCRHDKSQIIPAKYGYSRVIHLGEIGGQAYLLSAPAAEPEPAGRVADLFVWLLGGSKETAEDIAPHRIALEGVGRESIYSLLDLGNGRLVAGLRGEGRQAILALIDLEAAGLFPGTEPRPCVWKMPVSIGKTPVSIEASAAADEARPRGRNRMWSLAKISEKEGHLYRLAFGCDSGEIYEVEIDWDAKSVAARGLIGRMGSPVQVLACRVRDDGVVRVFAGGEDGAIVAWQDISKMGAEDDLSPRFGTLWATVEQGAVSQIHLLKVDEQPAVLVVTREGRYVTFDDRAMIAPPKTTQEGPSRVPMPGSRHGRRSLRSSAFASSLIDQPHGWGSYWKDAAEDFGAFAALLVATGDGRLRLVSLHNPEATGLRKKEYDRIVELWHNVLRKPIHFRLTEAAYKASPALSLIVVRSLLDHELDEKPFFQGSHPDPRTVRQALEESPWCLPRHLRPLFRLRLLWDDLRFGSKAGGPAEYQRFERLLSTALERAWRLDDLDLYQEICQVVLRRANEDLFKAVAVRAAGGRRITKEDASEVFHSVLSAIEHTLPRWLSADRQREARARIAVAKHLVDGDTARVLLREVARERERQPDLQREEGSPEADRRSFRGVLDERIRSVRELVNKRHPLVSLESLRAANLSLARMCQSLVEKRQSFIGETGFYEPAAAGDSIEDCEVAWPVFRDYSEELITAAVRAFRTPLELNDALAHEFSRSFALFICACPSATLPIESLLTARLRISEPEPEKGIFHRVLAQLKVLRAIGVGAPVWADELLRLGTQPPKSGWGWGPKKGEQSLPILLELGVFDYLRGEGDHGRLAARLGKENAENLRHLQSIHGILRKLTELVDNLETTAKGLDLSVEWRDCLLKAVKSLGGDYTHSKEFFKDAFEQFPVSSAKSQDLRKVGPETVRLSQPLSRWAEKCLNDIERMARDGYLFQPEVTTYPRLFRRLERAARNFPTSAAVQTNVVQGILGHHLLEDMDEHALELEEIAEVLNPRQVWEFRDRGRRGLLPPAVAIGPEATAEDFALYLLGRARSAETIPKSLRLLQSLLGPAEGEQANYGLRSFETLLQTFERRMNHEDNEHTWKLRGDSGQEIPFVGSKEARYLALVLAELDQNQRKHAWPLDWEGEKRSPEFSFPGGRKIVFQFWFAAPKNDEREADSNFKRLELKTVKAEVPIPPKQTRNMASSGTGLYLANLAAAIVGWELILDSPVIEKDQPSLCSFQVMLTGEGAESHHGSQI